MGAQVGAIFHLHNVGGGRENDNGVGLKLAMTVALFFAPGVRQDP